MLQCALSMDHSLGLEYRLYAEVNCMRIRPYRTRLLLRPAIPLDSLFKGQ